MNSSFIRSSMRASRSSFSHQYLSIFTGAIRNRCSPCRHSLSGLFFWWLFHILLALFSWWSAERIPTRHAAIRITCLLLKNVSVSSKGRTGAVSSFSAFSSRFHPIIVHKWQTRTDRHQHQQKNRTVPSLPNRSVKHFWVNPSLVVVSFDAYLACRQ